MPRPNQGNTMLTLTICFEYVAVRWTARCPKSMSTSGPDIANVPSIDEELWPVSVEATARWSNIFYVQIKDGDPIS